MLQLGLDDEGEATMADVVEAQALAWRLRALRYSRRGKRGGGKTGCRRRLVVSERRLDARRRAGGCATANTSAKHGKNSRESNGRPLESNNVMIHAAAVAQLIRVDNEWRAFEANGTLIAAAPVVVLANGCGATELADFACDSMQRVRGQLSYLPTPAYAAPRVVVSGAGYVLPAIDGIAVVGATYDFDDASVTPSIDGHIANLARAERLLPRSTLASTQRMLSGGVGFRCIAPDRMPMIGAIVDIAAARLAFGASAGAYSDAHPVIYPAISSGAQLRELPRMPGMYASFAFASRGLSWTALAAESLASQIEGEPQPLEGALLDAIDPGRFVLRRLRHGTL